MTVHIMAVENDAFLSGSGDVTRDVKVHEVAVERDIVVSQIVLRRHTHGHEGFSRRLYGRGTWEAPASGLTCRNTSTCGFAPLAVAPAGGVGDGVGGFRRCGGQVGGGGAGASPAYGHSGHGAGLRLVAALSRQVGGEVAEFDCSTHAVQFSCAAHAAQQSSGAVLSGSMRKASPR